MFIYFLVFIAILILSIVDFGIPNIRIISLISITLISFVIILFAGLRFEIGTDYFGYKDIFDRIYSEESVNIEFGYIFITKIFQCISNNYTLFIIVLFLLSFLLKLAAFIKLTPNVSFSLLVYFSTILISSDINQLRMGLSFSLILFSIYYIITEKKSLFYFSVLIASTIHYSALVFLPAYLISNLNISAKKYLFILFFALLNFFFLKLFLIDYFGLNILFLLNEGIQNKYTVYLDNTNDFESLFTIISRLFVFICFYLYQKKLSNNKNTKLLNLYFFSLIFYLTLSQQGLISSRLSGYYRLSELIILPCFYNYYKNTKINFFIYIIISFYLFLSLFRILIVPGDLYPYKNLLF